jgi:hypothetical protein
MDEELDIREHTLSCLQTASDADAELQCTRSLVHTRCRAGKRGRTLARNALISGETLQIMAEELDHKAAILA